MTDILSVLRLLKVFLRLLLR